MLPVLATATFLHSHTLAVAAASCLSCSDTPLRALLQQALLHRPAACCRLRSQAASTSFRVLPDSHSPRTYSLCHQPPYLTHCPAPHPDARQGSLTLTRRLGLPLRPFRSTHAASPSSLRHRRGGVARVCRAGTPHTRCRGRFVPQLQRHPSSLFAPAGLLPLHVPGPHSVRADV